MENYSSTSQEQQAAFLKKLYNDMVWISGRTFTMGSDKHCAEESPSHKATFPWSVDRTRVSLVVWYTDQLVRGGIYVH